MKLKTTHNGLLLTLSMGLLVACSSGESANEPAGSSALDDSPGSTAAAAPTSHTLAAGTRVDAAITSTVNSSDASAGDLFTARVIQDVSDPDGFAAIPAGSMIHGAITEVSPAPNESSTGTLTLAVSSVTVHGQTYDVDAAINSLETTYEERGTEKADVARIAGGAVAGAVLGRVIGGNDKGTIIGGTVGAATGMIVSASVKDMDIVLPEGARLTLILRRPLTVTPQ